MKKILIHISVLLMLVSPSVRTFAEDLFSSAAPSDAERAKAAKSRTVLENIYFAKHHKIVRINPDVIERDGEFTLSLFDGESVTLRTKSIVRHKRFLEWKGEVVDEYTGQPAFFDDPETGERVTGPEAEELWALLRAVQLSVVVWDVDDDTGVLTPQGERPEGIIADAPTTMSSQRRNVFQTVGGTITLNTVGKAFILKPIPDHPGLHLFMERNEDIKLGRLDGSRLDPNKPEDQEALREAQKYDQYLESVGIDRGNLKSDKQRAEEWHTWFKAIGVRRLPFDNFAYKLLESHGFDPTNIRSNEAPRSRSKLQLERPWLAVVV